MSNFHRLHLRRKDTTELEPILAGNKTKLFNSEVVSVTTEGLRSARLPIQTLERQIIGPFVMDAKPGHWRIATIENYSVQTPWHCLLVRCVLPFRRIDQRQSSVCLTTNTSDQVRRRRIFLAASRGKHPRSSLVYWMKRILLLLLKIVSPRSVRLQRSI